MAAMLGFIKNQNGVVRIAARIFETRLYNFYLASADMQNADIYKASQWDKISLWQRGVQEIVVGDNVIVEAVV